MRNTPLKAFTKSPIKHSLSLTEKEHKAEHNKESKSISEKLRESKEKMPIIGNKEDK